MGALLNQGDRAFWVAPQQGALAAAARAWRATMREKIGSVAPQQDTFGAGGGESTLVFDTDGRYARDIAAYILGFSFVEGSTNNYKLRRVPPLRHPRYEWMSASRVTVQYLKPVLPRRKGEDPRYTPAETMRYAIARMTTTFAYIPADLLDDDEPVQGEYDRFLTCDVVPGERVLGAENAGYQLAFTEGPEAPVGLPAGPPNAPYPRVPVARFSVLYEALYTMTWLWVPHDWLFQGILLPRLQQAVGKLNATAFLGCPAGTLLLEQPRLEKVVWPMRATGEVWPWCWNVTFPMRFFDPPRGKTDPAGERGHNLMPWRANNRWYDAKRMLADDTVGTERLYDKYEFKDLFKHWKQT